MRFLRNRPVLFSQAIPVGETQSFEEIERLFQSGGNEETAARRQVTEEKLENGGGRLAMVQIRLDHVDLVQVGQ